MSFFLVKKIPKALRILLFKKSPPTKRRRISNLGTRKKTWPGLIPKTLHVCWKTPRKFNIAPTKMMVGRRSFPFGMVYDGIFSGAFAVKLQVGYGYILHLPPETYPNVAKNRTSSIELAWEMSTLGIQVGHGIQWASTEGTP